MRWAKGVIKDDRNLVIIEKFAFSPIEIEGQWRWLETVKYEALWVKERDSNAWILRPIKFLN